MSSKAIKITNEIADKLKAAIGDEGVDVAKFNVYECVTLTTEPIGHKSGFYQGATFTRETLRQMADLINTPGKALPMQIMHDTNSLPVGRVFSGQLFERPNGHTELRTLFYIPKDKVDLVNDIDNAVIDEVSVGVMTHKALCSECGFDYFGPEATLANYFTLTCNEDHTIGSNGVHVRCTGLKDWAELSLVNRGAARDAKILSRAKQGMSKDTVDRLAASSGTTFDARLLILNNKLEASASTKTSNGDYKMDKETLALIQAKADEVAGLNAKLTEADKITKAKDAEIATLTATINTQNTEIATLKAGDAEKADLALKVANSEKLMNEVTAKLLPHAKASLTASGVAEVDLPNDFAALLSIIEKNGYKLHQIFGAEPKSDAGKQDANLADKAKTSISGAYKTFKS